MLLVLMLMLIHQWKPAFTKDLGFTFEVDATPVSQCHKPKNSLSHCLMYTCTLTKHSSKLSQECSESRTNPVYLGRRANTALIAQTAQNSIVAMVTNGTKYISQRKRPKPPSIKYHKKERTILPHNITWWMIVCSQITTNVNKFTSSIEVSNLVNLFLNDPPLCT